MASSTSAVSNGWSLQDIPGDELALLLKVSRKEATALRTRLLEQQADPAWVAATLDALPAATIALLSLVIEAGGLLMDDQLRRAARERFGMSVDDCRVAAAPAISRVLVVPLTMRNDEPAMGAVLPAASLIAPLVADLELAELPASGFVATESPARNARTFLATCVATRHLDVKLTLDGRPHRATIKRLAKQVGLDEASLEAMVRTGLDVGVLHLEGELVRPDPEALAEAAVGRYPRSPALAALCAQLPPGPVASAALFRSLQRRRDPSHPRLPGPEALGYLPGFAVGTVAGGDRHGIAAAVRRAPDGTTSGHVTPSFEVFLPPESRLLDIVHVGACSEWERLDRAFVGRITKASIARAAAAGTGADPILAGLAAAIRHPVPQNVEAAIRDWASSVIAATIATGHVIVVDPGVHARVAAALAGREARELAPGVFVVEAGAEVRGITAALTRAGVYHRELAPVHASPERASDPEPVGPGTVRLRDRVAAWRRGEPFEGVRDDYLDKHRVVPRERPTATAVTTTPAATTPDAMLARWALAHQVRFDDPTGHHGIAEILSMLSAAEVTKLLDTSQDVDQLLRALARLVVKRGWARPPTARSRRAPVPAQQTVTLSWQHEDLRERLQAAASRGELLAIQLAGDVRYLEITQVIRRGTTWMILGEDIRDDEAVALRLDDIQAIAALSDDFVDDDAGIGLLDDDLDAIEDGRGGLPRRPWWPAPGQAPPPGHLPCPCGSGVRYRQCCRDVPAA
jgi:hypothetical protein